MAIAYSIENIDVAADCRNRQGAMDLQLLNNNAHPVKVVLKVLSSGPGGCAVDKNVEYQLTPGEPKVDVIQICPSGLLKGSSYGVKLIAVERVG